MGRLQTRSMDDVAVGRVFRAIRLRLGWRQADVGAKSDVSQQEISEIERGQLERVALGRIRRVARVLEIRLPFAPRWRGGELDRLLDETHAAIVSYAVALLRAFG